MIQTWTDEDTGKPYCRDFECPEYTACLTRLALANAHQFYCLKDCPNTAIVPQKAVRIPKALPEPIETIPEPIKEAKMPKKGKRKDAVRSTSEIVARILQQQAEIKMKPGRLIKKATISSSTYHQIIHHGRIGQEVWHKIANALGVTTRWLLEGDGIDTVKALDNLALPYPDGLITAGIAESRVTVKFGAIKADGKPFFSSPHTLEIGEKVMNVDTGEIKEVITMGKSSDAVITIGTPSGAGPSIVGECDWKFKSPECGYAGPEVFCGETIQNCLAFKNEKRFSGHLLENPKWEGNRQITIKNGESFSPLTIRKTSETYEFKQDRREVEVLIDHENEIICRFQAATDHEWQEVEITGKDLDFLAMVQKEVKCLLAMR